MNENNVYLIIYKKIKKDRRKKYRLCLFLCNKNSKKNLTTQINIFFNVLFFFIT